MLYRNRWLVLVLLLPAFIILAALTVYPLASVIYYSFFEFQYANGVRHFVGLKNFQDLLGDRFFLISVQNTLVFTVVATVLEVLLGLGLAVLFNRRFFGRRIAVPLMIFPMMLSTMVVSAIWRAWYHFDFGLLNYLLRSMGLPGVRWLFDPDIALYSIVLVDLWQWTPMVFLIILAGLQSIPGEYYEAAQIDGASGGRIFFTISLPLIRAHLLLALLLRTIDTFKIFDKVFALTGGGPGFATETLSMYVYREGFKFFNIGRASAASIVMLVVAGALAIVYAAQILRGQTGQ